MAEHWQETATTRPQRATRHSVDAELRRIARGQKHLLRLEQLEAAGLSARAVRNRTAAGTIHRIHRAVFSLSPPPHPRERLWLAAVYAGGPGSALSDLPAAVLLGIFDTPPLTAHVTNATGCGRARRGIVVHRRNLDRRDVTVHNGIPCTSPARTVLDCASVLDAEGIEDLIMAADSMQILNRCRLEELVAENPSSRGISHIRAVITDDPRITRSRNERRLFSICREFGVPLPRTDYEVVVDGRTFYADFAWPDLGLIVEADSWRWHGGRRANESDKDRDQLLAIAGWQVVHFTRDQILHRRAETGKRLAALTAELRSSGTLRRSRRR
jgi:hypothetical protein